MAYALPGYLLFARDGTLMAQAFDAEGLQVTGEAFPVVEHIEYSQRSTLAGFSASESGVLVYQSGNPAPNQLTWIDRSGNKLGTVGPSGNYTQLRLSPDEKRVAVIRADPPAMNNDIWLIELARGVESRLTSDPSSEDFPVWSPDGSLIAFSSYRGRANIYQKLSSGAGEVEELFKSGENKTVMDWSADGRFILYRTHGGKTRMDIWVLPTFGDRKPYPILHSEFGELWARFSPDGRWVAYVSNETGMAEVYVQEFQGSGGKVPVSTGGGNRPCWRGDGKELFYISRGKLMAVDVKVVGSNFEAGVSRQLFEIPRSVDFEVSGDGQRFLIPVPVEETSPTPITVVLNWTADLKR
jgi:Tol biopolymer transport system component